MGACRRVPPAPLAPCLLTGGWGERPPPARLTFAMRKQHALQQTTQPFRIPAACRTCWLIFLLSLRLFITDAISPAPLPQFHYLFLPRRPVSFLPSQSFSLRLLQLLPLLFPAPRPSPLLTGEPFPAGCPQSTRLQRPFLQRHFLPSSEPLIL